MERDADGDDPPDQRPRGVRHRDGVLPARKDARRSEDARQLQQPHEPHLPRGRNGLACLRPPAEVLRGTAGAEGWAGATDHPNHPQHGRVDGVRVDHASDDEEVERQNRNQVEWEPPGEVVTRDPPVLLDQLATLLDAVSVWQKEVEDHVQDEDAIDEVVEDEQPVDLRRCPHHAHLVGRDRGGEEQRGESHEIPVLHHR
mmetsp:Transcript_23072/g.61855  ORF Transcript_23072/g.61855 Transcript_23072/m.61855 type:complete len:200 (+) Transcript_23072:1985-2584(+)